MSWINDIVRVKLNPPPVDNGVYDSLELYCSSESYDEYILWCVCMGIEPLFTRDEFEVRSSISYFGRHLFDGCHWGIILI